MYEEKLLFVHFTIQIAKKLTLLVVSITKKAVLLSVQRVLKYSNAQSIGVPERI